MRCPPRGRSLGTWLLNAVLVLGSLAGPEARAQVAGAIVVYPEISSLEVDSTRQFTAYVPISPNTVAWSVNDIPGGDATVGTISASGFYQPPPVAPVPSMVVVKARSTAYPGSVGAASLTLTRKYPWLWSASPAKLKTGSYQVSFNGSNFAPDSVGQAEGVDLETTYFSPTKLVVRGVASAAGKLRFAVRQPGPGAVTGNAVSVNVTFAPVTVSVAPTAPTIELGATRTLTATVTGSANTAVVWSVNGVVGGSSTLGILTAGGQYTAPTVLPVPATVTLRATSVASPGAFASATVTLLPGPGPVTPPTPELLAAGRFLEQSSFGPTPATLMHVQQVGIPSYLEAQFALPPTVIPTPSGNSLGALRQWVLYNYTSAPDQLRQRVAYSLGQIVVTSGTKLVYADEMTPWLRLLSQHAFGNYRDLLRDLTRSPSMGKYLDLANSTKPGPGGGANENYPRELLQLFSIGLWLLNPDGSQVLDAQGQPIPAYDQETVQEVALALTGWVYPGGGWESFVGPMESRPANHDTTTKTFLGCVLPAGQTVEQDLEGVLECLMTHPNTAPFLATRLIRSLVLSNPTPGYIQRVAAVFADNGAGVRGDLKAVVRAILTDAEARNDTATLNQGRLKEPILQVAGLLRALNGQFSSGQQLTYLFDYMAQGVLAPPSVFNWFSPLYRVPKSPLFGPEFQIYTPTEATLRGNFFFGILHYPGGDLTVNLSPFQAYGNDLPGLVEAVNVRLLYGRMPTGLKQALITAATPGYDAQTRIETVLYLTALSGQYAVQH